jgi:hypothetical protein
MFDRAGDDDFYDRNENRPASSSRKRTTEAQNLSGAQRWSQSGPSHNTKKTPVVIDSDKEEVDEDEDKDTILASDRGRKRRVTPSSKVAMGMDSDDDRKPSASGSKSARKKQAVKQVMGDGGDSVGAGSRSGKEKEGRKGGSAGGKSMGRGVIPLLKYGGIRSLPGPKTLNPKP